MKEMKPCPFCGSYSVYLHYNNSRFNRSYFYVSCDVCGARTRGEAISNDDFKPGSESEWDNDAADKSLSCWNQRAVNVNA